MNKFRIVTVVVTYNRLDLLKKCLASLKSQSVGTDIIVVNNGSNDGTKEWLDTQQDIFVFHQSNLGGSGGFSKGVEEAVKSDYDWVWIMDDDAFPETQCLEKLLQYSGEAKALCPLVIENDKIDILHRGRFDLRKINIPKFQIPITENEISDNRSVIKVDFISFIGLLIHSDVIREIGCPNKDYFIFHDDVEYSLRMYVETHILMLLVTNAAIYHKIPCHKTFSLEEYFQSNMKDNPHGIVSSNKPKKIPLFMLYALRNSVININKYSQTRFKNHAYILFCMFRDSIKSSKYGFNTFLSIKLLWMAYWQGVTNKIDNGSLSKYF